VLRHGAAAEGRPAVGRALHRAPGAAAVSGAAAGAGVLPSFQLVTAQPEMPLQVESSVLLSWAGGPASVQCNGTASFGSVSELKSAMRRFVKEEKLRLVRSPNEQTIAVRRSSDHGESSDNASAHAESCNDASDHAESSESDE